MSEIILAIETVASPASVCLMRGTEVLEEKFISHPKEVSSLLSKHVNDLINNNLESPSHIDKIAVSIGPGSFTGLRAGISTAKGMTFAVKKPLIGVDTLFAIFAAHKASETTDYEYYIPLIDARKDKAFASVYDKEGNQIAESQLINLKEKYFFEELRKRTLLLPLNHEFSTFFSENFFDSQTVQLSSPHVGLAAQYSVSLYNEQKIAYLEPNYVVNTYY